MAHHGEERAAGPPGLLGPRQCHFQFGRAFGHARFQQPVGAVKLEAFLFQQPFGFVPRPPFALGTPLQTGQRVRVRHGAAHALRSSTILTRCPDGSSGSSRTATCSP